MEGASWSYDTPSISNQNRFPDINHHQLLIVLIIVRDDIQVFCNFYKPVFDFLPKVSGLGLETGDSTETFPESSVL